MFCEGSEDAVGLLRGQEQREARQRKLGETRVTGEVERIQQTAEFGCCSDIQSFSFGYLQVYFLFSFVPPTLLVHNSSYSL